MTCAHCGREIDEGDDVFVCLDNWLQWHHFTKIGKNAGCFCSWRCFGEYWSVEQVPLEEYLRDYV